MGRIYRKRWRRGNLSPEAELAIMLGGSAINFHMNKGRSVASTLESTPPAVLSTGIMSSMLKLISGFMSKKRPDVMPPSGSMPSGSSGSGSTSAGSGPPMPSGSTSAGSGSTMPYSSGSRPTMARPTMARPTMARPAMASPPAPQTVATEVDGATSRRRRNPRRRPSAESYEGGRGSPSLPCRRATSGRNAFSTSY